MIFKAPAKINLGLHVKYKRDDGFHEIESIFHKIPLFDYVELIPSKTDKFYSYNINIPGNSKNNLCLNALKLLRGEGYTIPNYEIHLLKNIPVGAGLGGGSSDAVAVLKALNHLEGLKISKEKLKELSAKLGSDCPFFLMGDSALVTGRGEILNDTDFNLTNLYVHILYPNLHISSGTAYKSLDLEKTSKESISIPSSYEKWSSHFKNDFEEALWPIYPLLKSIKENLYNSGAIFSSLSGSGSSVFGVFTAPPKPLNKTEFKEWILKL